MRSLLVLLCLLVSAPSCAAITYSITDLGSLGGSSYALDLNDSGQVVGYSLLADPSQYRAFLWDDGVLTDLDPQGTGSVANAINNGGQIGGSAYVSATSVYVACVWEFSGSAWVRNDLQSLGGAGSEVRDINDAGQAVGHSAYPASNHEAVLWLASGVGWGAPLRLGGVGGLGAQCTANSINSQGQIAGYSYPYLHACVWDNDPDRTFSDLGTLGGSWGYAWAMNDNDVVVGSSELPGTKTHPPTVWTKSGDAWAAEGLPTFGGESNYALGVNNQDQIVGYQHLSDNIALHAFLYDGGVMQDLNDLALNSGWVLQGAHNINEHGQIVGWGLNQSGQTHAFLATPQHPQLAWLGTGDYMSDGVGPDTGEPVGSSSPTTFVFKVKYTDGTGKPPLRAQCVLQKRVCTVWNRYQYAAMTKESGDIATGAVYSCSRELPNEVFRYRFRFRAADGTWLTGDAPCRFVQGPMIAGRPKLCWSGRPGYTTDGVQPDSGPPGTRFKFQVLYQDGAGNVPSARTLLIRRNGRVYAKRTMNALAAGDFRMGKRYLRRVPISKPGTYEYRFRFRDASGLATGEASGWHSGPVITGGSLSPVALSLLVVMPTNAGAQISFSLSSPAQVQARILNIAGRPVRTLWHGKDCEAGTNTLVWNAQSDTGLPVPNGTYVVEMTAKGAGGSQARALGQVRIGR